MINSKLEEIRKIKKISKKTMAQKLGVSVAKLNEWESGKSEIPIELLLPIAKILNISVDDFLKYGMMMPLEEKNNLRRNMILIMHTESTDKAVVLAEKALIEYPEDNTLKLMIATVLFLGDSENRNERWIYYAIELLDSIEDWNETFMRSVIYTKAMLLQFLNENKRCEEELDKIDWNILDPYPLYAKIYRLQGKSLKQKKLACKRLYQHLNTACLMLEELSFSFEEPQRNELLYLQGQLSRMFGLSYLNAFLKLCSQQIEKGEAEKAKALLIEYLKALSELKNHLLKQSIFNFIQKGMTSQEEQMMIQKSLNEIKENPLFDDLLINEEVQDAILKLKRTYCIIK